MTDFDDDDLPEPEYVDGFVELTIFDGGGKLLIDQYAIGAIVEVVGATLIVTRAGNFQVKETPAEIRQCIGTRRKELFVYQRRWMAWRREMDKREGRFE